MPFIFQHFCSALIFRLWFPSPSSSPTIYLQLLMHNLLWGSLKQGYSVSLQEALSNITDLAYDRCAGKSMEGISHEWLLLSYLFFKHPVKIFPSLGFQGRSPPSACGLEEVWHTVLYKLVCKAETNSSVNSGAWNTKMWTGSFIVKFVWLW